MTTKTERGTMVTGSAFRSGAEIGFEGYAAERGRVNVIRRRLKIAAWSALLGSMTGAVLSTRDPVIISLAALGAVTGGVAAAIANSEKHEETDDDVEER